VLGIGLAKLIMILCFSISMNSQSFGQILQNTRRQKGIDLKTASSETKILLKYLQALEEENESEFATMVQLRGFLQKYCLFLGLDFERQYALYRRDFGVSGPRKKIQKPAGRFSIPKQYILPLVGISIVVLIGLSLLINVVVSSLALPKLQLTSPIVLESPFNGFIVTDKSSAVLEGKIMDTGVLRINNEPVPTDVGGVFKTANFPLKEGDNRFELKLTNSLNREGVIVVNIQKVSNVDPAVFPEE